MNLSLNRPSFPNFKILEITDKVQIETFTKQFPPYSDFNFVSIWSYDTDNDVLFSWFNGNFVIRFRDYTTKSPFYSFLGNSKPLETILDLIKYSEEEGLESELKLIPEDNIKNIKFDSSQLFVEEDLAQNDYIIPLKESLNLSNINPHKQESYYKFLANNPDYKIKQLDISDPKIQGEIIAVFNKWVGQKKNDPEEQQNEFLALKKLLENCNNFDLNTLGIYINNELVCYIIDERLQKPYVIGHFLKADLSYKGIYEVMNKVSAQNHYREGYRYINIEQDLGIEGLRISKKQRSPAFYLKKYKIKRRLE